MLDIALLLLMAFSSVAIATRLERGKLWLTLPTGFVSVAVLRVLSVVISAPLVRALPQIRGIDFWIFVTALIGISLPAIKYIRSHLKEMAIAVATAAGISMLGYFSGRGLNMAGLPHGDSIWILTLSEYISHGGDPVNLGTQMSLKRGFSLILMLGLGKSSTRLDAVLPIIYAMLILVSVGLAWQLLKNYSARVRYISIAIVGLLVYSSWMAWVTVFYVNGHTLVALGLMVAIASMLIEKSAFVNVTARLTTFCLGLAIVTFTRPEGVLLSLIVIALFAGYGSLSNRSVLISVASIFTAFLAWMVTVNSYILPWNKAPLVAGAMLFGLAVLALALYRAPKITRKIFWLTPWLLAGLFAVIEVLYHQNLLKGENALVANLLLGQGRWGMLIWALLLIVSASTFVKREAGYSLMLRVLISLGIASLLSKMLDGGITGEPTLGREGWVDSLNRMWVHLIGVFVVISVLGVAQLLTNKFVGFHLKSKKDEDSHNAAIDD